MIEAATLESGTDVRDAGLLEAMGQLVDDAESIDGEEEREPQEPVAEEVETEEVEAESAQSEDEVEAETETVDPADVAEVLGLAAGTVSADDDGNPVVNVTVNGEQVQVSPEELVKGYSREADYTRKTSQLADDRRQFQAESETIRQRQAQEIQALGTLVSVMKNEFLESGRFSDQYLAQLRESDPAEWSATVQEKQQQAARLDQYLQAAQASQGRLTQEQQQQQQEHLQKVRAEEEARLLERIPSWSDQATRQAESQALATYLVDVGYSEQEVGNLLDSRAVEIANKARLYDQMQSQGEKAVAKKIKKAPKLVRPGTSTTKQEQKAARRQTLATKARQSGSERDALAYLLETNILD